MKGSALAAVLFVSALGWGRVTAQTIVTEIIDVTGDGAGNGLIDPRSIAVDAAGNVYVAGGSDFLTSGSVVPRDRRDPRAQLRRISPSQPRSSVPAANRSVAASNSRGSRSTSRFGVTPTP